MSTTISEFIDQAWNDHVTDLAGVARRLCEAGPLLGHSPDEAGSFVALAEHVLLGHMGDADAMERCMKPLVTLVEGQPSAAPAWARARLAMALLRGADVEPLAMPLANVIRAHGTAACGLAARGDVGAARGLLLSAASKVHDAGDNESMKALAASYHNLASQLLDSPREPLRDGLMMEAALKSRDTWSRAGTWLNEERADCVLALCAAAVGDSANAVAHARAGLALCDANQADAFERFFAQRALGQALLVSGDRPGAEDALAEMRVLIEGIADSQDRSYAQSELDQLAKAVAS